MQRAAARAGLIRRHTLHPHAAPHEAHARSDAARLSRRPGPAVPELRVLGKLTVAIIDGRAQFGQRC